MERIRVDEGMLYYLIERCKPDLAKQISASGRIETIVVGLGNQGTKHAGLMHEFGTTITAGIAPERGGSRIHEVIPVYDSVEECVKEHPNIAAASIWRHYSNARSAVLEVIEAGVPIVLLISEGIPLRDVRDVIVAARRHNTLLIGGNTPGAIFPPEGIKIGMLPDVFYPEEVSPGRCGPRGVTILSRSGAILYHMSDALASVGIAQNAVIGVGGDGAVGAQFHRLVPIVSAYENTDLVVVAGEIGGCQEELLARDVMDNPHKYPKPIVALISGAHAPEGKTMGHAGAIVSPGQTYGTFASKKEALTEAGIRVCNSQYDLIKEVKSRLKNRTYFQIDRYYEDMSGKWDVLPKKPSWGTLVTRVAPNSLMVSGYRLEELIDKATLLEAVHLLIKKELPSQENHRLYTKTAIDAARLKPHPIKMSRAEDISKYVMKCLLMDPDISSFPQHGENWPVQKTAFTLGRVARYLCRVFGNELAFQEFLKDDRSFTDVLSCALGGGNRVNHKQARMLEALIVACVDHGVTPPSAQATRIAASVRADYDVALANGVGAITDVHGGAGAKAADFFKKCVEKSQKEGLDLKDATHKIIEEYVCASKRIEGLGHRYHTKDPRRDALWNMAVRCSVAGRCVEISRFVSDLFEMVRGIYLPINVDGVIGAIVADMGLPSPLAKAIFLYGRIAGLSAHYFEEVASQPPMRRINFEEAVYRGAEKREYPQ